MLHCNNNNSHNRIKGSLNAAMGVVPGPSDLELVCSGYVLFLECKTPTGTQDQPQKDFQKKVEFLGHKYVIFRSLEQFKQIIWENIGR